MLKCARYLLDCQVILTPMMQILITIMLVGFHDMLVNFFFSFLMHILIIIMFVWFHDVLVNFLSFFF